MAVGAAGKRAQVAIRIIHKWLNRNMNLAVRGMAWRLHVLPPGIPNGSANWSLNVTKPSTATSRWRIQPARSSIPAPLRSIR